MGVDAKPVTYDLTDGTESSTVGPTLTGGAYTAGALDNDATASAATAIGADLTGDFTINVFRDVDSGSLGSVAAICEVDLADEDAFSLQLALNADGAGFVILNLNAVSVFGQTVAAGVHQFSARRESGIVTLLIDGVPVGTPEAMGNDDTAPADLTQIMNNAAGTGRLSQVTVAARAMRNTELVYLFNEGTPIAYASMELNTVPAAITGMTVSNVDLSGFTVNWSAPADGDSPILHYQVWKSVNGGSFAYYDNAPADATSYRVSRTTVPVSLKLKAVNSLGAADTFSNSQTA